MKWSACRRFWETGVQEPLFFCVKDRPGGMSPIHRDTQPWTPPHLRLRERTSPSMGNSCPLSAMQVHACMFGMTVFMHMHCLSWYLLRIRYPPTPLWPPPPPPTRPSPPPKSHVVMQWQWFASVKSAGVERVHFRRLQSLVHPPPPVRPTSCHQGTLPTTAMALLMGRGRSALAGGLASVFHSLCPPTAPLQRRPKSRLSAVQRLSPHQQKRRELRTAQRTEHKTLQVIDGAREADVRKIKYALHNWRHANSARAILDAVEGRRDGESYPVEVSTPQKKKTCTRLRPTRKFLSLVSAFDFRKKKVCDVRFFPPPTSAFLRCGTPSWPTPPSCGPCSCSRRSAGTCWTTTAGATWSPSQR